MISTLSSVSIPTSHSALAFPFHRRAFSNGADWVDDRYPLLQGMCLGSYNNLPLASTRIYWYVSFFRLSPDYLLPWA